MHKRAGRPGADRRGVSVETLEGRRLLSAGFPDYTFDFDGQVTFDGGGVGSSFMDVQVQDDGRIVTIGQYTREPQGELLIPRFAVFRYMIDGQLDPTFGDGDGIAELPTAWDPSPRGLSLDLLPDGRIVAGGDVYFGGIAGVARFTPEGQPDLTFGYGSGVVHVGLHQGDTGPVYHGRVVVQDDGGFYIVGGDQGFSDLNPGLDVYHFNTDGTRDYVYGQFGVRHVATPDATSAIDAVLAPSGKLLISGNGGYFVRLTTDGALDATFGGGDGIVQNAFGGATPLVEIAPLADDGFYAAGGMPGPFPPYPNWSLLRKYTASGALDTTWGLNNSGERNRYHESPYHDLAVQSDGKLIVLHGEQSDFMISRLNADGLPDPTYGTNGTTTLDFAGGDDSARALALDAVGRAVVVGSASGGTLGAIARLTGDFPPSGTVTAHVAQDFDGDGFRDAGDTPLVGRTVFVDVDSNGRFDSIIDKWAVSDSSGNVTITDVPAGMYWVVQVVPSGWKYSAPWNGGQQVTVSALDTVSAGDFLTTAFSASPHLDTTFGSGGSVIIGANDESSDYWYGIERVAGGKLICVGYIGNVFTIARFNGNGTPDSTFGPNGRVTPALPANLFPFSAVMAVQSDGKILVSAVKGNPHLAAVIRFNADGSLDTAFGSGGGAVLPGFSGTYLSGIAVDSLGRIVAATNTNADSTDAIVARLTPSGQLDSTFDGDGVVTHNVLSFSDHVYALAVQSDNRIILAGTAWDGHANAYLLRLGENGGKDSTFGVAGLAKLDIPRAGGGWEQVVWHDVKVMPDGRIIAGGYAAGGFAVARYTSGGVLDGSFAAGAGYALAHFQRPTGDPVNGAFGHALALLGDGSIYLAGSTYTTTEIASDVSAVRFRSDGTLEQAFGGGGKATAPFGSYSDRVEGAVVDPASGRLIVAGRIGGNDTAALIARFAAPLPDGQSPYVGLPFPVGSTPVTIQFEDFDNGGEGVAYHDVESSNLGGQYRSSGVDVSATSDGGGGYYVGFVKTGEWLEYTIDVAQAGNYTLDIRLAAASSNGKFHVEVGGIDKTDLLTVPNTGGFQNWTTLSKTGVNLPAGQHVLRVFMDAAGSNGSVGNFNWVMLTRQADPPPAWMQASPDAQYTLTTTVLTVSAGTISLMGDVATTHPNLAVSVLAGAELEIAATQHLASLDLADGAQALLSAAGEAKVLVVGALTLAGNATLDLKTSSMIVNYTGASPIGSWGGSSYGGLTGRIAAARNGGGALWQGFGVASSAAAASDGLTTLAISEASQVLGLAAGQTATWQGQTVDATSVLLKYTFAGDANLDGKINIDDYGRIDGNVASSGSVFGYFSGDFNYDGKINIDDYGIIDGNINRQGAPMLAESVALSAATMQATVIASGNIKLARALWEGPWREQSADALLEELK